MNEFEIAGEIAVLKARSEATRWVALLTVAALIKNRVVDGDDLFKLIEAKALDLASEGNKTTAEGLLVELAQIKPLSSSDLDPAMVLIVAALQKLDAGPDRQTALREWLSFATEEEISEELSNLVQRMMRKPNRDEEDPGE